MWNVSNVTRFVQFLVIVCDITIISTGKLKFRNGLTMGFGDQFFLGIIISRPSGSIFGELIIHFGETKYSKYVVAMSVAIENITQIHLH